jgi:hypothetical protein
VAKEKKRERLEFGRRKGGGIIRRRAEGINGVADAECVKAERRRKIADGKRGLDMRHTERIVGRWESWEEIGQSEAAFLERNDASVRRGDEGERCDEERFLKSGQNARCLGALKKPASDHEKCQCEVMLVGDRCELREEGGGRMLDQRNDCLC